MLFLDTVNSLPLVSSVVSANNLLLCSIVVAAALIYLPYLAVAIGRFQVGYDMGAPRGMFDKLPEYAQRATWAHQNAWESFSLYAPAALMGYVVGLSAEQFLATVLLYLGARVTYALFYILNVPILRSLSWAISIASIFTLYFNSCGAAFH